LQFGASDMRCAYLKQRDQLHVVFYKILSP
jgi:hypothetical protein